MKLIFFSALLMAVAACSSNTSENNLASNDQRTDVGQDPPEQLVFDTNLPLPSVSADASCTGIHEFTGGDLKVALKRIVAGTVTSIDAAPFQNGETSCPLGASLSLVVKMDVEENLLGEGDTVEFYLDAREAPVGYWSSTPRYRMEDGTWVGRYPNSKTSPPARVTENLGWTEKFGIYPGERLLVMLYTNESVGFGNNVIGPGMFPIAKGEDDETFVFQEMTNNYLCINLPEAFTGTTTLDAIRAELLQPPNDPRDRGPHEFVPDFSNCWTPASPSQLKSNDAGTD